VHRAGARLALIHALGIALWHQWHTLFHGGGVASFRAFWGGDQDAVHQAYRDRTGAALVRLWRAGGTRALDPAILRLLNAEA
jgi:hypothetical protein